ncbi:MAG: DNA repair protein RecO [Firmicutes bacterium]|nr:DNA repair protein RecO [Bacillota bacterium]
MGLERVEGVVIRTRDLGEADRIVSLYTRERGKVRAVARGARRPRNRFASLAQVPIHGRFGVFQGKGLGTLSQGELITSFKTIRTDLVRTAYALLLAELYDHMMEEGEPAPELFRLLLSTLHVIDGSKHADLTKLFMAFELKFLLLMGYGLELDRCVKCGNEDGLIKWISSKQGGLICEECLPGSIGAVEAAPGTIQVMRRLLRSDYRLVAALHVSDSDCRIIKDVLRDSLEAQLSSPLKSLDFLESMISGEASKNNAGRSADGDHPGSNR